MAESIGVLKELMDEGKIRHAGLCEVSAQQIEQANEICPISAVQSELSLWSRDAELEVLPMCEAHDIAFVAFSPLGRGFLTGKVDRNFMSNADETNDFRKRLPRFNDENIDNNLALVKELEKISNEMSVPVSQISLAWVLAKSKNIHIIPGSKTNKYLQTNFSSQNINLDQSLVSDLNEIFSSEAISGSRYP
jgi:aryl-alcohol dehydrogenase-like predicted oxidoreductase